MELSINLGMFYIVLSIFLIQANYNSKNLKGGITLKILIVMVVVMAVIGFVSNLLKAKKQGEPGKTDNKEDK
jgi:H+/Cl- antiporter ClcA